MKKFLKLEKLFCIPIPRLDKLDDEAFLPFERWNRRWETDWLLFALSNRVDK